MSFNITFKPKSLDEIQPDDVIVYQAYSSRSGKHVARRVRLISKPHWYPGGITFGVDGYLVKKDGSRAAVQPRFGVLDVIELRQVESVTRRDTRVQDPAEAYDAAHAEDAALTTGGEERLHSADVYKSLGYGRDLPGEQTAFPGTGERPLPSGRLITIADVRKYAKWLLEDLHREAAAENDALTVLWGQSNGTLALTEAERAAEQARGGYVHAYGRDILAASSATACGVPGWRGPSEAVTCPECRTIEAKRARTPEQVEAEVTAPTPADALLQADLFTGRADRRALPIVPNTPAGARTAEINVVTGVIKVSAPESDNTDFMIDGSHRTLLLTLEVEPWGAEEYGYERADENLHGMGWRRVSEWTPTASGDRSTCIVTQWADPLPPTPAEARTGISDRVAAALNDVAALRNTVLVMCRSLPVSFPSRETADRLDRIEAALRGAQ